MTEGLCHWSRSRAVENRARSVGGHTVCTECAAQEVARQLEWVPVRGEAWSKSDSSYLYAARSALDLQLSGG